MSDSSNNNHHAFQKRDEELLLGYDALPENQEAAICPLCGSSNVFEYEPEKYECIKCNHMWEEEE